MPLPLVPDSPLSHFPTSPLPLASIVIPTYNGAHHLPVCLDALRAQVYPDVEVLLVDNGSTDGTQDLVGERYPEVRLLEMGSNLGLTGANNAGFRAARGDVLISLNNDTEADPGFVAALVDALRAQPEAGIAAAKMLLFDRRDVLHSAGDGYRVDGLPFNRGVWQRDKGQFDTAGWVFGGCGGAVAYRRAMLDQIGAFDESFFMYCEDVDLNWRAQLAGWRAWYTPHAIVYHKLSATGGGPIASYYTGRNTLWVVAKNYPDALLKKYRPLILRAQWAIARDALRAWRGAAARARLRGQLAGLRGWPRMKDARRAIQSTRRVSDEYVESLLTPMEQG
ncbi:MAG: glycosyltransferase family 2 protein [Anaerolineae bacterium]|nr:glycosyltransferase family 2 protein [Anaerolineae bacterium]